jgi:O-antigen biosynthesis protein
LSPEITSEATETRRVEPPAHVMAAKGLPLAEPTPVDDQSMRLFVDRPSIAAGKAQQVIRDGLVIEGWALADDGVAAIEVFLDGNFFDGAKYGERREDIAAAFPGRQDARLSGYGLAIPPRALENGTHQVRIELITSTERRTHQEFLIEVDQRLPAEGPWALRRKMPATETAVSEQVLAGLGWRPRFGLLMGIDGFEQDDLAVGATLATLRDQVYRDWHLFIVLRGKKPEQPTALSLRKEFADMASRMTVVIDSDGRSIEDVISQTSGGTPEFLAMLSPGDRLGCDALLELAVASGLHPEADFFYGDERRTNPDTGRVEAFFKPDWSPELLLATNYIGRIWCAEASLLADGGATIEDWRLRGEYDLVLRLTEAAHGVVHLPKIIAQRAGDQVDNPEHELQAIERAMGRRGITGRVESGCAPGYYRAHRTAESKGLVSIIIPTCASRGLIQTCIETLRTKTAYRNFEIVCVENIPEEETRWKCWLRDNVDKVVETQEQFNWSRFNNLAVAQANGEYLLFLNDDIEVIEPDWLDAMLEYADREEVGAVGARLFYPDRKIQHAGIFWSPNGGRHAFRFLAPGNISYFGLAATPRNVLAVTGACLLVRRAEFDRLNGFDERHDVTNNDVDFCLRLRAAGKRIVYTPYATLIHHELASRSAIPDDFDTSAFSERWATQLQLGDPFYHPALATDRDDFSPNTEPLELVYAGRPLIAADQIRKILVVKLDHIGDFITAIPALRRLHEAFPAAKLTALGPPLISSLLPFVPEIGEVIHFEFFHARSGLGAKKLTAEDMAELSRKLAPYNFDLAIDLRKSPDTRPILQWTGARWLAGFDRDNWFPWLDVSLEWEGDHKNYRKRTHVADDLVRLVDAVVTATKSAGDVLERKALSPLQLAEDLHRRRLVCVHPGVGAATRQWPADHYAELIDLLVAGYDVNVAVIGGPDEAEIANEVIEKVRDHTAVRSLVGKVNLSELPTLLASSALYVGNNSGPKHIAAGLGVPTVGIHSGAVDAREWGPIGQRAVAVRRDVHCSPCYFAKVEDCPRQLACLTDLRPSAVYEICGRLLAIDAPMSTIINV